jgi:hypothetical protein
MPASGGTPLARLHDTATQLGIIVVDAADDDGPLLDDDTAAFIACGVCIAVNPGLDDDLRAEVLAMALALTHALGPGTAGHAGDITAAGVFALISRAREIPPVSALGLLATVIAHEHGHDTASAAFEYTLTDSLLAQPGRRAAGPLLGDQPSEYLDIGDVFLPPWPAVAQVRKLLLHGQHAGRAHGQYRCAIESARLVAKGSRREQPVGEAPQRLAD